MIGIVFSCDGHREGQPCRGALTTRTTYINAAHREANRAGWRHAGVLLCPSREHDEETRS